MPFFQPPEGRNNPLNQRTDYLKVRLHRMVRFVLKEEQETTRYCPSSKNNHVFIKGAWLVFVGMYFTLFAYTTYDRISFYFTYPVAVDVFITSSETKQFPELTICFQESDASSELIRKFTHRCFIDPVNLLMAASTNIDTEEIWLKVNGSTGTLSAQEINKLHVAPLNYKEIALTWGTCRTYRTNDSNKAIKKGDPYLKITFKRFNKSCTYTKVYIHDPGDFPMWRQMLTFPSNLNGEIAMTIRKFLFVNRTNSLCVSSTELRECLEKCLVKFIIGAGATDCRYPFYPPTLSYISNNCKTNGKYHSVVFDHWNSINDYLNGESDIVCNCPKKCEHTTFSERKMTHAITANETTTFVLRYHTPFETLIKERLCYGPIALFCDIGGNSGLFVGLSVLSFFQLGHMATRLKKKATKFSVTDPLYRKVIKTYTSLKKQGQAINQKMEKPYHGKLAVLIKTVVISVCTCLLIMTTINRLLFFFQYPMQTIVEIGFNTSLETPTLILCPLNSKVLKLRKSMNKSNPCDVKVRDLLELTRGNFNHLWPIKRNKPVIKSENQFIDRYPEIPFYDGTCIDLNDGTLTIPGNRRFIFVGTQHPECGTEHIKAYLRSSTGYIDYSLYIHIAHKRGQQMLFIFKEIHLDRSGVTCISTKDNEQCLTSCLYTKLFNQINCRLPYMRQKVDFPLCNTSLSFLQTHLAFRDLFFRPANTEDCNCFPKCNIRYLEISQSVDDAPALATSIFFGPIHNVIESYVIIPAYPLVKLLCDIGGLLGSTLGFSLLGITETALSFGARYLNRHKSC